MFYLKKAIVLPLETVQEPQTEDNAGTGQGPQTGQTMEEAPEKGDVSEGGVLYITDDSRTARRLLDEGRAVLVYLHAGNRQEDFGFCKYACEDPGELDMQYLERVYRRYRGIPWEILETERCLVRETTVEDVDDFYRIYRDPSITEYMEPLYADPEEERAYARDYIDQVYAFYHFGIWTVVEKDSGEIIGRAGICFREGFDDPELGFVIAADRQGRGLATEVCRAVLQYSFQELGFERIHAFVQPDNLASLRVCDKLEMENLGRVELQGQEYVARVWNAYLI
ncbi:MAG: GNAT family N-acetyltransferase [Acetatifactor sp.]|nr:GNAT family N-acetyltransferase [Acetatifactor sp.]